MYISRLTIDSYRNYSAAAVEFADGVNVICGDNAQGKTNLVEAVMLTSIGRSPRTPRDKELIMWDRQRAEIGVQCQGRTGADFIKVILDRNENKRVALNNMPLSRLGEMMGKVATVFFSPDELKIVKSAPAERRRFMDIALCQLSRTYFYLLSRYNKILGQRNKQLKSRNADALEIWDIQLAETGAKIIRTRKGFIKRLAAEAAAAQEYLTGGKEKLEIAYEGVAGEELKEIERNLGFELVRNREKDLLLGFTGAGAQKDDIAIMVNGVDLRSFGSQGQQRTAALALKLAEMKIMREETGEYPVLILDDVLSELDNERQTKLLKCIGSFQSLITCTHLGEELSRGDFKLFKVNAGSVAEAT